MTQEQFTETVRQMRIAQKTYFKSPTGSSVKFAALDESRRLEKQVDALLENHAKCGQFQEPQTKLF